MVSKRFLKFYLEKQLLNNTIKKEKQIEIGCLEIINYIDLLLQVENDNNSIDYSIFSRQFSFDELRTYVSNEISDNDFILIVFYLCQTNIDILKQKFSALKPKTNQYEDLDNDQVSFLMDILESKYYKNPITGDDLTEQNFAKQVVTYFVLSDKVKNFLLDFKV